MLTQNIRENGQIFGKNKIWQRNKLLSLDVRTDLGDLGLTQSICPQSEKKKIHENRASKMSFSIEAVTGLFADGTAQSLPFSGCSI